MSKYLRIIPKLDIKGNSILKENIFACQFHPEKSGLNGIKLIKNFLKYEK
tara:strand:- start:170 stop:319 length:150 start_codon:yes stop_codon:yes gene_type:complete